MANLILTPANPAQQNGLALLETLPTDILLQICSYLHDWKDVLDLLKEPYIQVSTILYRPHSQREIWSLLVSRSINALDALRICYLDHPIYFYSAEELRRAFIRWKMAANAWSDRHIPPELRGTELSAPTLRSTSVNREMGIPFATHGRSILAPGGRWLIALTDTVSAVYYDLDCIVDAPTPDLEPYILFTPQLPLRSATGPVQISMSLPDADPGSPLKFRFAVTFATSMLEDSPPSCILQIWEVTTVFVEVYPQRQSSQTRLSSTLLASISSLPVIPGAFIFLKALAGNNVVVDIPKLRQGPVTTCLSIIDWTTARLKEDRFRRRVVVFSDTIHSAMPVGTHNLLFTSRTGIFLYNYRRTPVIRKFSGKGFDNLVNPEHSIFCKFIANGEFQFVSTPVTIRSSNGTVSQKVACCNSTGEMYLVSISPRPSEVPHCDGKSSRFAGDLGSTQVDNWYLGNSPARKAFKRTLASTTTMRLGINQGVILEQIIRKYGGMNTQLSIVCYEREALDRLARSVNDDSQDSPLGAGTYGDYVIGQVISRDIPLDFGGLSRLAAHGDNINLPSPAVLFFDESIARVVLHIHGRGIHVVDL